ncbi:hypothetical protein CC2G_005186 [Coprinopsis cinerea AmutBmut pab1-1]|nr:hypothetical protein CC2G_005186 [Coprinopsis cinerea AmutBmut pab1-1]
MDGRSSIDVGDSPITPARAGGSKRTKRPREDETESQRIKREKAAERQRRKRERDRAQAQAEAAQVQVAATAAIMALGGADPLTQFAHLQAQVQHPEPPVPVAQSPIPPPIFAAANLTEQAPRLPPISVQPQVPPPPPAPEPAPEPTPAPAPPSRSKSPESQQSPLTPEELERREKVRAAARERQRKHRLAVKQRKMRELGLDVDLMTGAIEDIPYQPPPPTFVPELPIAHSSFNDYPTQIHGGQTFASTLLLSFSCAPLLKAHLLRTLNMTNEELASLEPVIAEAWDRWNAQRQLHYAEAAKNGVPVPPPPVSGPHPAFPVELAGHPHPIHLHPPPPGHLPAHLVPPHHSQQQPPQPSTPQNQHQQAQPPSSPVTPLQHHPPAPTFAVSSGPSLSPHPAPPETNPALDFRARFSSHLNRPIPSAYRNLYGDSSPSTSTTGSSSTAPSSSSSTNSGNRIEDADIDPHLMEEDGRAGEKSP